MAIDDATVRGIDLKLLRVARRVPAVEVARAAGWSRQRVGAIEAADRPGRRATARYFAALERASGER